jgi:AcrR family transcriptional regulator
MSRVADHDARRRQVAEAVEHLIADGGLDGVTVARTAAAAGISVGLVQHYFPTKDDMLLHTFTAVRHRIEQRVTVDAQRADAAGARIEHILLTCLTEMLPFDDLRRRECRVALAFTGRAIDRPRLAEALQTSNAHVRTLLARAIHNGKECGEVPDTTNEHTEAALLLAHADGLVLHAYNDPATISPSVAQSALAAHLHRIFPGPCRQPSARAIAARPLSPTPENRA